MTDRALPPSLNHRIEALRARCQYRLLTRPSDQLAAYAMRYRAYLREGAISSNETELLQDRFDELSNAFLVGVLLDDTLVGSVRLHVLRNASNDESPALDAFSAPLAALLKNGACILDPNRLVLDPDASRANPDLHWVLLRIPMIAAAHFGATVVTATVRAEHQAFYRRALEFSLAAGPAHYPTLRTPLRLMTAPFVDDMTARVYLRYPFMRPDPGEGQSLFGSTTLQTSAVPSSPQRKGT